MSGSEKIYKAHIKFQFVMVDNMEWFNVFGLIFIAVIMIPNVVFAIKCKDGFDNKWNNKYVEVTEQVGRLGCFGFMIINIPGTWFGWWSDEAFALYLIVDTILVMLYCAIWIICFKKNSVFRALALSIMDMYIRMYDELKRSEGDNPTIGIVLCSDTDDDIARYSVMHGNEQLFASKYKLYLPTKEELKAEIETQKAMFYLQQQDNEDRNKNYTFNIE